MTELMAFAREAGMGRLGLHASEEGRPLYEKLGFATNPIALIVPCHRVVREDGSLSGYRWGLARKQALLEREGDR